MAAKTRVKRCEKCGNEYKPTSNAQKYCADCGEKINLEKTKNRMKKKRKAAIPAAKVLPKPAIKIREKRSDDILSKLLKERDEHRQALTEIETTLRLIKHYTDAEIPGLEAKA